MSITPTKTVHHFNDKPNVKVSFCGLGLVWPPSHKTKEEIPLLFACFSSGQSPKMESTPKSRADTNKNRTNRKRVLSALEENNMTAESWSRPEPRRGYELKSTYSLTSLAYFDWSMDKTVSFQGKQAVDKSKTTIFTFKV